MPLRKDNGADVTAVLFHFESGEHSRIAMALR
jgi:hypothetical protein